MTVIFKNLVHYLELHIQGISHYLELHIQGILDDKFPCNITNSLVTYMLLPLIRTTQSTQLLCVTQMLPLSEHC